MFQAFFYLLRGFVAQKLLLYFFKAVQTVVPMWFPRGLGLWTILWRRRIKKWLELTALKKEATFLDGGQTTSSELVLAGKTFALGFVLPLKCFESFLFGVHTLGVDLSIELGELLDDS